MRNCSSQDVQTFCRMTSSKPRAFNKNKRQIARQNTGLVVMGGDSCSEGRGFESQHHILDGHFSHLFVVKILTFV